MIQPDSKVVEGVDSVDDKVGCSERNNRLVTEHQHGFGFGGGDFESQVTAGVTENL